MKRHLKTMALLGGGLLSAMAFGPSASAETTLSWVDGNPNRGARADTYMWFADELTKQTNGEIKVEFHWAGALLKWTATTVGVGSGSADIGTVVAAYNPKELTGYSIGDLPLANSDIWVGMRAIYDLATTHPALQKMWDDLNLVYLTNVTTGAVQLLCKNKIVETTEDLKGLKIRAVGPYGQTFNDFGANVVRMEQPKVYSALDSGVVDCNMNYLTAIDALKQNEVAKKLTMLDWGQNLSFGVVMNKDSFNKLTPEQQTSLRDISSEFIDIHAKASIEAYDKSYKAITEGPNAVEVGKMKPEEQAKLEAQGMTYFGEWVKRADEAGLPGQDIFDTYMQLVAKYTEIRDTKGYPWAPK
ncbi:C4-dicarboxylate TRAP transporter substrate-binding protein [Sneathiella sp.]|uniref:C4-dicarboxylate TRAP transporter substrate-binding protein n=1 Tax=Sneathiella sp. TaxID=1964365 RepID=UPI002FE31CBD